MRLGITGHQHIPEEAVAVVREELIELVERSLEEAAIPPACVTSLAEGADQMFATLVLKRGGALHVIVPCKRYEESFEAAAGAARFALLLAEATTVETLPFLEPSEEAFLAAGRRVVDLSDQLVAVWDGEPARGKGGTADIVAYARSLGVEVSIVWPDGLQR
jgi:hypothetical protein